MYIHLLASLVLFVGRFGPFGVDLMLTGIALVMLTPLPDLGRTPPQSTLPPLSDLRRFPAADAAEARCRALHQQH